MKTTQMATRILAIILCIITRGPSIHAQYYYKDIVSNRQALSEKRALKEQNVRNILVHSFEGNGEASPGFFCEKKISKDYRRVETYTKSNITGKSLLTTYYNEADQLVQSTDSSEVLSSTTVYEYDSKGNISRIISNSHSADDDFSTRLLEEHQYSYDTGSRPARMLRIRNHKDTTIVSFTADEHGNITDETETGKNGKHYYYYYNDKNRLTDIVKFNPVKGKLLPDFLFEYNGEGQVTKMVAVEEGIGSDYNTWRYVYNDGLRIIEKCFSKENTLLGYFEYEYN
jgi:YD repeat-containing protein